MKTLLFAAAVLLACCGSDPEPPPDLIVYDCGPWGEVDCCVTLLEENNCEVLACTQDDGETWKMLVPVEMPAWCPDAPKGFRPEGDDYFLP